MTRLHRSSSRSLATLALVGAAPMLAGVACNSESTIAGGAATAPFDASASPGDATLSNDGGRAVASDGASQDDAAPKGPLFGFVGAGDCLALRAGCH